jgi:ARG and Rhodanese-Phosphatase-superfamily-associated Protein domain
MTRIEMSTKSKAQGGAAFAINGEIVGFGLFDRASTLAKLLPKLVSSYAIQALSRRADKSIEAPGEEAVRESLDAVSNSQVRAFTAIGEGEDVRIEEAGLSAVSLVAKGRLIHLCSFRVKAYELPYDFLMIDGSEGASSWSQCCRHYTLKS